MTTNKREGNAKATDRTAEIQIGHTFKYDGMKSAGDA